MKLNAPARIVLVAATCAAALITLVLSEGATRSSGQEVLIAMEAVDPRAILSGHYVQINLTQRLTAPEQCPAEATGDWVALRQTGDRYIVAGSATSRDGAQLIGLPVKGTFTCNAPTPASDGVEATPGWLNLDLHIDRFHTNQTDAERIERILREQRPNETTRAFAIVSIGRDGRARLKGLQIDGERLELSWL